MSDKLEQLYFEYNKKNSEIDKKESYLHSLKMDTFTLNKEVSEVINELNQLRKDKNSLKIQIEEMEEANGK